jgi:hypothetical protein
LIQSLFNSDACRHWSLELNRDLHKSNPSFTIILKQEHAVESRATAGYDYVAKWYNNTVASDAISYAVDGMMMHMQMKMWM